MRFPVLLAILLPALSAGPAEQGAAVFRSNCAFCHGLTGRGGRGPDLVGGKPTHGGTPDAIRAVIVNGVPGTTMPAFRDFEQDELDALLAYIGTLSESTPVRSTPAGDAGKGRAVYAASGCGSCHSIGGEGSIYGPDLSRIGAARSLEYLRQSIVDPSADIPPEWEGVTVVDRNGRRVQGVRLNEDTFSVQLRDASQQFRLFTKDQVREVIHEKKSLMPAYASMKPADLDDLLAYLDTLRGALQAGGVAKPAGGIR